MTSCIHFDPPIEYLAVAYTVHEMSLRSSDVIKDHLIDIVPLVFIGIHTVTEGIVINSIYLLQ